MKLTLKQKAFADYYVETGNATEAAVRAGYSKKTAKAIGSENLTKPAINEYIQERLKAIEDSRIADGDEVLRYLTSVMRGESQSEVVVVEGVGDGCSEAKRIDKSPDEKERLKAAELLGKRYRLFTERVEVKDEAREKQEQSISNIQSLFEQMKKPDE